VVVPFFSGYALPCLTGRVCHVNLSWLAKKQGRRKSVVLSRLCGAQLSFLWGFIVRAEQAARLCRYPFGRSKAKQTESYFSCRRSRNSCFWRGKPRGL